MRQLAARRLGLLPQMPYRHEQTQLAIKQPLESEARVAGAERRREALRTRALAALEALAVVVLQLLGRLSIGGASIAPHRTKRRAQHKLIRTNRTLDEVPNGSQRFVNGPNEAHSHMRIEGGRRIAST